MFTLKKIDTHIKILVNSILAFKQFNNIAGNFITIFGGLNFLTTC